MSLRFPASVSTVMQREGWERGRSRQTDPLANGVPLIHLLGTSGRQESGAFSALRIGLRVPWKITQTFRQPFSTSRERELEEKKSYRSEGYSEETISKVTANREGCLLPSAFFVPCLHSLCCLKVIYICFYNRLF